MDFSSYLCGVKMKGKDMATFIGKAVINVNGHEMRVPVRLEMPEIKLTDNGWRNGKGLVEPVELVKDAYLAWSDWKLVEE